LPISLSLSLSLSLSSLKGDLKAIRRNRKCFLVLYICSKEPWIMEKGQSGKEKESKEEKAEKVA
jgi:hypothetical protein